MKFFTQVVASGISLALSLLFSIATAQSITTPTSVTQLQQAPAAQFPDGSAYANSALTYNIIDALNNTFGYDVFVDGKLMIHQASIPAMPGNEGFKTQDDAAKVAELVMNKIRKGEMPPTVSTKELQDLHVIQ